MGTWVHARDRGNRPLSESTQLPKIDLLFVLDEPTPPDHAHNGDDTWGRTAHPGVRAITAS